MSSRRSLVRLVVAVALGATLPASACFFHDYTVVTDTEPSGGGSGSGGRAAGGGGATSGGGSTGDGGASLGTKWHPGVYVWNGATNCAVANQNADLQFIRETIEQNPNIEGIELKLDWACLENDEGQYAGIAYVKKYVDELQRADAGKKRRVMLVVNTSAKGTCTTLNRDNTGAPDYFQDDWLETCKIGRLWTLKLWDPVVMDRMIALSQAFAAAFDEDPGFEMFSFATETDALTGDPDGGYLPGNAGHEVGRFFAASKVAWKHTLLRNPVNYLHDDRFLGGEIKDDTADLTAFGGPDTLPADVAGEVPGNRLYRGIDDAGVADLSKTIPWVAEVGPAELCGGKFCHDDQTFADLMTYARETMKDSYVVWVIAGVDSDAATAWPALDAFIKADGSAPARTDCFAPFGHCSRD